MVDELLIRKYVLINATEHEGKAQPKSVLGKILSDNPEMRSHVLEIKTKAERMSEEINKLSPEQQKKELDSMGGYTPVKREERKGLPELEITREKFTIRFAPNPDGAIHMGNARPAVLCDEYAKKYNGILILRIDDTDPKVKFPEKIYYKWLREDLKWLKIKYHKEIIASKRLPIYYKYAEILLKAEKAYICTCNESWKKLRDNSRACPCREAGKEVNMRRWRKMLSLKGFKEGEAVLRVKTDLHDKNPAVRDWPGFRIVDKPKHPFVKKKVWPLYNFASAIDDHLLNITHIFRGQEHSTNETKQRYLYQHMGWKYPLTSILGRFSMSDMVLSKSLIREGIREHKFEGWDDPKVGTIRSLRRRGFQPETLRQMIVDIGMKPSDITISFENLSSFNRRFVDEKANRYFFIRDLKKIEIKNIPMKTAKLPLHPTLNKGFRTFSISKTFYIELEDFNSYKGLEVRLKDLCNVKLQEPVKYTGTELKPLPKIQWLPQNYIPVRIMMPDKVIKGYGEPSLLKAKVGDVVQFERFGFVRIEKVSRIGVNAIFGHE